MEQKVYRLFTDGGSRGNPGPAACGFILFDENDRPVSIDAEFLGEETNNVAEYRGILAGLKTALKLKVTDIKCYLDSELIVMQANGAYRVKQKHLKVLWDEMRELKEEFNSIKFIHVRREKNWIADKLVNIALDAHKAID